MAKIRAGYSNCRYLANLNNLNWFSTLKTLVLVKVKNAFESKHFKKALSNKKALAN
jgi:hypothetical protein